MNQISVFTPASLSVCSNPLVAPLSGLPVAIGTPLRDLAPGTGSPLMLRLNGDWNVRGTDRVAVRMIEQQRQALEVMADLIDRFETIAQLETARQPALLTDRASRSAGVAPRLRGCPK